MKKQVLKMPNSETQRISASQKATKKNDKSKPRSQKLTHHGKTDELQGFQLREYKALLQETQ